MRKTMFFSMCVPLLLVGLFCVHLVAQPDGQPLKLSEPGEPGAIVFDVPLSVLDPKVGELSERELLEMKVNRYRRIVEYVENAARVGGPRGAAILLAEARANLASVEIELYHHTGEQDKLHAALEAKVKALTDKVRAALNAHENGTVSSDVRFETEAQLLDALLERKRASSK